MTTATAKRPSAGKPASKANGPSTIQELIRDAIDNSSGLLPQANDPERFGKDRGRRLAVVRFLSSVVYEDPRLKARRDAVEQLLDTIKARLGPEGRDLDAAIGCYETDLIQSAAQLALGARPLGRRHARPPRRRADARRHMERQRPAGRCRDADPRSCARHHSVHGPRSALNPRATE